MHAILTEKFSNDFLTFVAVKMSDLPENTGQQAWIESMVWRIIDQVGQALKTDRCVYIYTNYNNIHTVNTPDVTHQK